MKLFRLFAATLFIVSCSPKVPETFHILATTDLHGAFDEQSSPLFSFALDMREKYGDNFLLMDCGDNLQGSAEMFFSSQIDIDHKHIFAEIMEAAHPDAMALGNHDYEVGRKQHRRYYSSIDIPVLCANIVDMRSRRPIFKPYTIIHKKGYKIAVLGLVSTEALEWLTIKNIGKHAFVPMVDAAKLWVDRITRFEHPDLIIGLFHAGINSKDVDSAYEVAVKVSGIPLICGGHVHRDEINYAVNPAGDTVTLVCSQAYAKSASLIEVQIQPGENHNHRITITPEIVSMEGRPVSKELGAIVAPFMERASRYLDIPVSYIDTTIYARDALYGPSAWSDMLHHVLRKMTERMGYVDERAVDVTIVSPSSKEGVLHKGMVTLRDLIRIYPYDNGVSIMEMRGSELIDYLDYSYSFQLDHSDTPIYFYDTAAGFNYYVVKDAAPDRRVRDLETYTSGYAIYHNKVYRVAMNSFRASGGNGFLKNGLGWSREKIKARTLDESDFSIRDALVYLYASSSIDVSRINNWEYR